MSVEKATRNDLATILAWLKREYEEDGEGFWSNRNIIRKSYELGDLWVIRRDNEAVAFQVGDYAADIVCVRRQQRRQGLGTELFEASLERSLRDNVNVLLGECSPRTSLPFWEKHGFERYGDMSVHGRITVRRVLPRPLEVPANLL